MLQSEGVKVRSCCRSGAETIREIMNMGSGIVICGYKLADMTALELAFELKDAAFLLLIAQPLQLDFFDQENVYKLPPPVSRNDMMTALENLQQMEEIRYRATILRRSPEDELVIEKAKALLMEKEQVSEEEAHQFLQRRSMSSGLRKTELARRIIGSYEKNEEDAYASQ